jgi:hypothetical protein
MKGFNIRVNFLQSGIDIKIDGNSITNEDIQEMLQKVASRTPNAPFVNPPKEGTEFTSMYDQMGNIGKDIWTQEGDKIAQVVDKTMKDFDKAFDGFDDLFGNSIDLNPFDTDQVKAAQDAVKSWGDTARKYTEATKTNKTKESQAPTEDKTPTSSSVFGVEMIATKSKSVITQLDDLKKIPEFYIPGKEMNFNYFYNGEQILRNEFLKELMFGSNKVV